MPIFVGSISKAMFRTLVTFSFLASTLLGISGCDTEEEPTPYQTTPYELQIPAGLPEMPIPADNPMTVEGVALGRRLFYDEILSGDNTQSCASCHKQEFGFSDDNRFSEGITGALGNRQAMALINLGWNTRGFFWDGRAATLEQQALGPVNNPIEMNTTWQAVAAKLNAHAEYPTLFKQAFDADVIDSTHVTKALAQFMRTLISGNSRMDKWYVRQEIQLTQEELRGYTVFNSEVGDCFHCHSLGGGLNTDNKYHNNGMDTVFADPGRYAVTGDPMDLGRFRTPTLRNIELTAPYMHDGRFFTLEEVIDHYSEHVKVSSTVDPLMELVGFGGAHLTDADKQALIAFLRTFTDQDFVSNPDFSDPGQ